MIHSTIFWVWSAYRKVDHTAFFDLNGTNDSTFTGSFGRTVFAHIWCFFIFQKSIICWYSRDQSFYHSAPSLWEYHPYDRGMTGLLFLRPRQFPEVIQNYGFQFWTGKRRSKPRYLIRIWAWKKEQPGLRSRKKAMLEVTRPWKSSKKHGKLRKKRILNKFKVAKKSDAAKWLDCENH